MILFRRQKNLDSTTPWPAQGVAFRFGQWLGVIGNRMSRWSRLRRASIVLVGMALAIVMFWTGRAGWAVIVGGASLALFWLSLSPTPAELADREEVSPPTDDEN